MTQLEWAQVTDAIALAQSGHVDRGKAALLACWASTGRADHAMRCVVAHFLADLEDDLDAEIAWDELALAELPLVRDEDLAGLGVGSASGFAPSLHLNLGDGYLRRGDLDSARQHLARGRASLDVLQDDAYGVMIAKGFDRLATRILDPTLPRTR